MSSERRVAVILWAGWAFWMLLTIALCFMAGWGSVLPDLAASAFLGMLILGGWLLLKTSQGALHATRRAVDRVDDGGENDA